MGMALAAIGTAITVVGQVRQANAQAAMYEHQAQVQEYNYKVRSAERDEQRKRVMANQRSSYAAQGVDPGSGSALDVYARSAGQFAAEDTQDK